MKKILFLLLTTITALVCFGQPIRIDQTKSVHATGTMVSGGIPTANGSGGWTYNPLKTINSTSLSGTGNFTLADINLVNGFTAYQTIKTGSADGGDYQLFLQHAYTGIKHFSGLALGNGSDLYGTVLAYDVTNTKSYLRNYSSAPFYINIGGAGAFDAGTNVLNLVSTGQLTLPQYTSSGSFTGTPAGYLAFTSLGNVITTTAPSSYSYWTLNAGTLSTSVGSGHHVTFTGSGGNTITGSYSGSVYTVNIAAPSLTGYVPYTGATGSANMGASYTWTALNFILYSDIKLKRNINPIKSLSRLDSVKFKQFTMKDDTLNKVRFGVIAQEVEEIVPEVVTTDKDGVKTVAYIDLLIAKIARMNEVIKELDARIKTLENAK